MHFLLLVALAAGASAASEYSQCDTTSTIVSSCAEEHLAYLKEESNSDFQGLQTVSNLEDPFDLLNMKIDRVCNQTMHLKMYVSCVYTNLTTCLTAKNSSQADMVPDATIAAEGIVSMCDNRNELNISCIEASKGKLQTCVADASKERPTSSGDELCTIFEAIYACTDHLGECGGVDVMKDFYNSVRPHHCSEVSTASTSLITLSVLLLTLISSLILTV